MTTLKLEGAREIERALQDQLPSAVRRVLRKATASGAAVIRDAARQNAKRQFTITKVRSKISSVRTKSFPDVAVYEIGARATAYYLNILEVGAAPHFIKTKGDTKALRFFGQEFSSEESGLTFRPTVKHPGFTARPWLRPALDQNVQEATNKVGETLLKEIEAEAAKTRSRTR